MKQDRLCLSPPIGGTILEPQEEKHTGEQHSNPQVVFVTASNSLYRDVCLYNAYCAKRYGKFDKVIVYDVDTQISKEYRREHADIFATKRGAGLWLWKVFFIEKAFHEECNEGDILFYADAASFFFRSVKPVISKMKGDILAVNLPFVEEEFTKCETFALMELDSEEYRSSRQFHASFMAFRKNKKTEKFVEEWKHCCEDIRLLSQDVMFGEQIPSFVAHRNDQSLFSLLCKKYGVHPSEDPSQYGITGYGNYKGAKHLPMKVTKQYPFCIMLHKQRKWNKAEIFKSWLRIYKRYAIIEYRKIMRREVVI